MKKVGECNLGFNEETPTDVTMRPAWFLARVSNYDFGKELERNGRSLDKVERQIDKQYTLSSIEPSSPGGVKLQWLHTMYSAILQFH